MLTKSEHKARHIELHKSLDELFADFLYYNPDKFPSNTTILELIEWSFQQSENPTPIEKNSFDAFEEK